MRQNICEAPESRHPTEKTFGDPGQGETRVAQPQREIGAEVGVDEEKDPMQGMTFPTVLLAISRERRMITIRRRRSLDRHHFRSARFGNSIRLVNDHDAHSKNEQSVHDADAGLPETGLGPEEHEDRIKVPRK